MLGSPAASLVPLQALKIRTTADSVLALDVRKRKALGNGGRREEELRAFNRQQATRPRHEVQKNRKGHHRHREV
jgi:hypothetical protein